MSLASVGFRLARPVLHALDAETAHALTIASLRCAPKPAPIVHDPVLASSLFGLTFPSPLGLAAGFDKNGEVYNPMLDLGIGFAEVGTTTPLRQDGNQRPRLFRLREDLAVINRMGFNNEGHDVMYRRLAAQQRRGVVGVNIGANKATADRAADYVAGVKIFSDVADYITINVSSPNTPGLRGLQSRSELTRLLARLRKNRDAMRRQVPLLLKIAPDLGDDELADIASCCAGQVDGVIISNTTISRPALRSRHAGETGGLSGMPLFDLSTRTLARFFLLTGGKIPLVGAGGISDTATAWAKITAGASLLQLYSALVFKGPALIAEINAGLANKFRTLRIPDISSVVGSEARRYAHQTEPGT